MEDRSAVDLKILVIGLGSMGKRRIRLLKKFHSDFLICGVDLDKDRCVDVEKQFDINTYQDLEYALTDEKFDCAFISTAPLSHAKLINTCLKSGLHVFTELNLVDNMYEENLTLAKQKDKVLFLSSTFLYRKEIEYIKNKLSEGNNNVNYVYHAGQYLPDWHPWESYEDFFVGKKETNGCREFLAIELPWMTEVFGNIRSITALGSKMSNLKIDYADNYMLMIEHDNGNKGLFAVDIVSRKPVRNLEVFGEEVYFTWDGTPDGLVWYDYENKVQTKIQLYDAVDKRAEYAKTIIEDAYYSEIVNFFDTINHVDTPRYSFEKDKVVISKIDDVEKQVG